MTERKIETESLTKSLYHIELSRQYMEDFSRSCKMAAKNQALNWLNKLSFVRHDVYSALTPASRELFHEELNSGDILFTQSISEKWIRMTQDQRELLETVADGLLKGEKLEFVPDEK